MSTIGVAIVVTLVLAAGLLGATAANAGDADAFGFGNAIDVEPPAVIGDSQYELMVDHPQFHLDSDGPGMADGIGQGFLGNAIQGDVDIGGQMTLALHGHHDRQASGQSLKQRLGQTFTIVSRQDKNVALTQYFRNVLAVPQPTDDSFVIPSLQGCLRDAVAVTLIRFASDFLVRF